jgi:hypothetical protein
MKLGFSGSWELGRGFLQVTLWRSAVEGFRVLWGKWNIVFLELLLIVDSFLGQAVEVLSGARRQLQSWGHWAQNSVLEKPWGRVVLRGDIDEQIFWRSAPDVKVSYSTMALNPWERWVWWCWKFAMGGNWCLPFADGLLSFTSFGLPLFRGVSNKEMDSYAMHVGGRIQRRRVSVASSLASERV